MTLSRESVERIGLLVQVAKENGALVTVQEISRLMAERASELELAEAIASDPVLGSRFELKGGFLTERRRERGTGSLKDEASNRLTASTNLGHAFRFVGLFGSKCFKMVAVSGSTSYGSAARSKDLDLFCVAPAGTAWLCLTSALVMAKVFNSLSRASPPICLSCIMDEDYARLTFARTDDPLFARDALETKVVKGRDTYENLMRAAPWISRYYPRAYGRMGVSSEPMRHEGRSSAASAALNRLLYAIVGRYLTFKAWALNCRLQKAGRGSEVFEVRSSVDHLIYESKRYSTLRAKYGEALRLKAAPKAIEA